MQAQGLESHFLLLGRVFYLSLKKKNLEAQRGLLLKAFKKDKIFESLDLHSKVGVYLRNATGNFVNSCWDIGFPMLKQESVQK